MAPTLDEADEPSIGDLATGSAVPPSHALTNALAKSRRMHVAAPVATSAFEKKCDARELSGSLLPQNASDQDLA